ncbi:MAG: ATP-binding protein [bacterium]|nr:ATP-binding protein [bacterium]
MLQSEYSIQSSHPPQSERFIQSALDALSAHIAILNRQGVIIGVNVAWRRFGDENHLVDPNYCVGMNYLDICDKATGRNNREAGMVAAGIREVMNRQRDEFKMEYPCHSTTRKQWFVLHVTRFSWEGQDRFIVAHQDVTELKVAQVELSESQKRIQAILDNVMNGIITLDSRGFIETANIAACAIFEYTVDQFTSQSLDHLMATMPKDKTIRQFLEDWVTRVDNETVGKRSDGRTFPMYFAVSKVALGNKTVYIAIIQDITERKRLEAEVFEKEKLSIALQKERELRELKNRFITMMSHELRTPLASIMLSNDLLKLYGDQAPPEEKMLYIENIRQQVELLTDLIKDVATISRTDVHNTTMMPELINIVDYCKKLVGEFSLTHKQTHRLRFVSNHDQLNVMVDIKLMRQVFSNLISNALKYSPKGGDVVVTVGDEGRFIEIRVKDSGIGIPKADQPHLFEPFHRGSNVGTTPGTGLGLAIAKQAIILHNGTIEVESHEGKGTTILVRLPVHFEMED